MRLIDADALKAAIERYADDAETASIINTGGSVMSWEHRQVLQSVCALKLSTKIVDEMPTANAVELPKGKPGAYLEWDNGTGWTNIYFINSVNIYPDGELRYDLGKIAPVVDHPNIRRILTRDEAEKELKRRGVL